MPNFFISSTMSFQNLLFIKTFIFLIFATIILIVSLKTFDSKNHRYQHILSTIPIHNYGGIDFNKRFSSSPSEPPSFQPRHAFLKKRTEPTPRDGDSGISVAQQGATSQTLENGIHQHYEEESEDWWEVYRTYEYETTDDLGDLFRVEVEEA